MRFIDSNKYFSTEVEDIVLKCQLLNDIINLRAAKLFHSHKWAQIIREVPGAAYSRVKAHISNKHNISFHSHIKSHFYSTRALSNCLCIL